VERILYPRREAAELLAMSVRTLDQYAKVGEIHPRYQGGKVVYHRSELERFARMNHCSPFTSRAARQAQSAPQSAVVVPIRPEIAA